MCGLVFEFEVAEAEDFCVSRGLSVGISACKSHMPSQCKLPVITTNLQQIAKLKLALAHRYIKLIKRRKRTLIFKFILIYQEEGRELGSQNLFFTLIDVLVEVSPSLYLCGFSS